jgi:hypothetical protein
VGVTGSRPWIELQARDHDGRIVEELVRVMPGGDAAVG